MSGDKSAYYGGYSLYRGNQAGGNQQQQRAAMPTFQNDWNNNMLAGPFGNNNNQARMAAGGVFPLIRNFFMPMPMYGAAPQPQQQQQQQGSSNFYKGAPLTRPTTAGGAPASANHHHHAESHANKANTATTSTANKTTAHKNNNNNNRATASKVLRGASDTWGAFDGIAPLPQQRSVDPIGTPAPRSVWADTPVDGSKKQSSFSLWGSNTSAPQAQLWKAPNLQKWVSGALESDDEVDPALLDKATRQSMMAWSTEAAAAADESSIQAMLQALTTDDSTVLPSSSSASVKAPAPICDAPLAQVDSDDEWMDHFQESVDRAMRQPSLDVALLQTKQKVDKEWSQHQLPQAL